MKPDSTPQDVLLLATCLCDAFFADVARATVEVLEHAGCLLAPISGVELVEFGQEEQCCGFGGTFSVTFPHISGQMGTMMQLALCLDGTPPP